MRGNGRRRQCGITVEREGDASLRDYESPGKITSGITVAGGFSLLFPETSLVTLAVNHCGVAVLKVARSVIPHLPSVRLLS